MALPDFDHFFDPAEDNSLHRALVMTVGSLLPIHRRTVEPPGIMGDLRIFLVIPPVQLSKFVSAVEQRDPCIRNDNAVQQKDPLYRKFQLIPVFFHYSLFQSAHRCHGSAVSRVQSLGVELIQFSS